jgi:hypothetical protein
MKSRQCARERGRLDGGKVQACREIDDVEGVKWVGGTYRHASEGLCQSR